MVHRNLLTTFIILAFLANFQALYSGPSTIFFTEVFYDTPGDDTKEEWFELYNATNNFIDIGNYTIHDNSSSHFTIPIGTVILAGEVLVFAKKNDGFYALYGFYPDFANIPFLLNNSGGDLLALKNPAGEFFDMVAWENEISGWDIEATTGRSLQRISFGPTVNDWQVQTTPDPGSSAPIPEPSTILLLGSGMLGFGIISRFRRKIKD